MEIAERRQETCKGNSREETGNLSGKQQSRDREVQYSRTKAVEK